MKLLLLLAALLPAAALALEEVDAEASHTEFTFRVRKSTATLRVITEGLPFANRLVISFSDPHVPQQVIPCDDASHSIELRPADEHPGFESADYDGNGFNDFSFEDASGTAANHIRHYFFYTPAKRRFVRRSDFDESGVSNYDADTGLFSGYWRSGPSAISQFYRFERGRLSLVRRVEKGYADSFRDILPHAPDDIEYLITTLYQSKGRMRRFYTSYR